MKHKKTKNFIALFLLIIVVFFGDYVLAQSDEYKNLFLAKQVFEDGFYDSAQRHLEKFLRDYPYSKRRFEVEFLIAKCYLKQNNLYKASSAFEILLKKARETDSKKIDEITFWIGETYFKGKDYQSARQFYQRILRDYPGSGLYS